MKRFVVAVTAVLLLAGSVARAQTTWFAFTTVDAVNMETNRMSVTGVLEGAAAASTATFYFTSGAPDLLQNCQKLALLAMTKPGQYLLKINPGVSYGYPQCTLARVAP